VERNRAKRRLREATALIAPRDGTTYVVIAQPGVNAAAFSQLVSWLARAYREAGESVGPEERDE
jgi:ribonuclease P protein component